MPPPERTGAARARSRHAVSQIPVDADEDEGGIKDEEDIKRELEEIEQLVFGEPARTAKSSQAAESVASSPADSLSKISSARMSRTGPQKAGGTVPNSIVVKKHGRAPGSDESSASATKRPRVVEEGHGIEVNDTTSRARAPDKKKHRARYNAAAVHANGYFCARCARAVLADKPVAGLIDAALLICGLEKCSIAFKCLYCRHASKGCELPVDEAMSASKSAYAAQVKYELAVRTDQSADIIAMYKDDLHAKVQSFLALQRQYSPAKPAKQAAARGAFLPPPSRASETPIPNLQRKETASVAPTSEANGSTSIAAQAASALTPAWQERIVGALESIAHSLSVIADVSRASC